MLIGQRLREIREMKNLSQDDIEKATGLVRPYISRVENGHTIPSVGTLQKWTKALEMQLYQVLYEGDKPPKPPKVQSKGDEKLWGNSGREARQMDRLRHLLASLARAETSKGQSLAILSTSSRPINQCELTSRRRCLLRPLLLPVITAAASLRTSISQDILSASESEACAKPQMHHPRA